MTKDGANNFEIKYTKTCKKQKRKQSNYMQKGGLQFFEYRNKGRNKENTKMV